MQSEIPAQENKMGVMPINKLLLSMSLPIMISMLVQALYNVVDSVFVARVSEAARLGFKRIILSKYAQSAQIDRIGVITAKILEYQKSRPEKAPQLHSFLSYYLPTTLKILRAYGQLESQQIAGENITAAMKRVEGMMDKVVEGFEKQLDQLFQGDTMDITADVDVLEQMLARDGLTGEQLRL